MTDLVEFIEARLTQDENHARKDLYMLDRASNGGAWEYGVGYNLPYSELGEGGSIGRLTATYGRRLADGEPDQHNADVMLVARLVRGARRRAERVLREVEAKRAALQLSAVLASPVPIPAGPPAQAVRMERIAEETERKLAEAWLRLLALPYADHPDYRQEWAP